MNEQMVKLAVFCQQLWYDWNNPKERDRGSQTTETAIIVGVIAVAAVGLTVAITAAIDRYKGKLP